MSHTGAFLGEQIYLDSRLSFGFDVANAYKANDDSYIWLARRLAQRAGELLYSNDIEDQISVSYINSSYRYEAHAAIAERLHNKLDTRLVDKPLYWLQYATDRDIALFTIANRELHLEHQAALDRDRPQIADTVLEGVEALVKTGYYPKEAIRVYRETIDRYGRWKAIDPFESGARRLGGYCTLQVIALSNTYTDPLSFTGINPVFVRKANHELSHGIDYYDGRGFEFQSSQTDRYKYFSFIGEAMAEHNAVANEQARHNQMNLHIMDPSKQVAPNDIYRFYEKERILCGVLGLDAAQLAEVQISSIFTRKGRRLRSDVLEQMNRVFGSEQNTFNFAESYDKMPHNERDEFIDDRLSLFLKKSRTRRQETPARPLWHRVFSVR